MHVLSRVEKLSVDHDVEAQFWTDEIKNNILTSPVNNNYIDG